MSGRVLVLGAINQDLVVRVARLPLAGETVLGEQLVRHHGGKGANQAVAAARAGGSVLMLGAVGNDEAGESSLADLASEGVDVAFTVRMDGASGTALIAVAPDGSNQIVVAPGANGLVSAAGMRAALDQIAPTRTDVLLASLEVPMAAVLEATVRAAAAGATVVVNPAPAIRLPEEMLEVHPILTPNRAEIAQLTDSSEITAGARRLLDRGAKAVVVTLGKEGCAVFDREGDHITVPASPPDRVVDSTGAGDTFSGVLAAWLAEGRPIGDAAAAATLAASMSVSAAGARGGMPTRDELDRKLAGS